MKLSQLIHAMDRDDKIIVNTCKNVPINKKCLYQGKVRGIYKDSPLNKGYIRFLMASDDMIIVEISLDGRKNDGKAD